MRFLVIAAMGLFMASSASTTLAQHVSNAEIATVAPPRASASGSASTNATPGKSAAQAKYTVPDEVREVVERNAELRAMEAAGSDPVPTISTSGNN